MNRSILKSTMVILTTVGVLFSYVGFASVFHNDHVIAYAQKNQTSSSNQTTAKVTGTPQSTILNKTTIPAQQTTVKVNQTTKPVGQQSLKPLQNLTQQQQQQPGNLSGIKNKTMVVPTGKATTTLVNKTTVPFNQTIVKSGSANQTQQQQPGNVTSAAGGSSNSSSGNQTQQQKQNQTNPLSKVPVIGKLFGGK
jgi:hypothetical protein